MSNTMAEKLSGLKGHTLTGMYEALIILNLLSTEPTSIGYLVRTLSRDSRTIYRKITILKQMGFGISKGCNSKYILTSVPLEFQQFITQIKETPITNTNTHD